MKALDVLDTFERLRNQRQPFEQHWRDVEAVVPPFTRRQITSTGAGEVDSAINNRAQRNRAASRKRYDTTMMRAVDRLTSGVFSLTVPDGQKWHGLSTASPNAEETKEEKEWAEKYRDLMFHYRYLGKARFQPAMQAALYSTITYGPGYVYTDPTFAPDHTHRYRAIPVDEAFIDKDNFGEVSAFAQRSSVKAINVPQDWDVSEKVTAARDDIGKHGQEFEFVQLIVERKDKPRTPITTSNSSDWVGYTVEVAQKRIVKEEAFETFPVACFFWDDTFGLYGSSPCINYLLDQRTLNAMERDTLIALQMGVRPPTGGPDTGLLNRLNLSPGAHNPGAVGPDGSPLVVPLNMGGNPERAFPFMEVRRDQLNDGMYTSLFQMLAERSGQTATEVLQRANEKAQLLGPVGARMHAGMNMLIEREQEAIRARGVFADDSPYLPPETLAERDIRPVYTNPMVRLQKASQAEGTMRMMELDAQRQQMGLPSMLKDVEAFTFVSEALDVPTSVLKSADDLQAENQEKAEDQAVQQNLAAAESVAKTAATATPAIEAMNAVPSE